MTKYNAVRTKLDGYTFASKREAVRYGELKLALQAKAISDLNLQVPYSIEIGGKHICKYIADFVYTENGQRVVEDCKGFRTDVYKLKKKLVEATYNVTIRET